MRLPIAAFVLLLGVTGPLTAVSIAQDITVIEQHDEQRIQELHPGSEERVVALNSDAAQQVREGTTPVENRGLHTAGKVAVGVFATAFSLGVMAASLLFI